MEKFLNSETSLISLTTIVTIFIPKKTPEKGILIMYPSHGDELRSPPLRSISQRLFGEGKSHLAMFPPCVLLM